MSSPELNIEHWDPATDTLVRDALLNEPLTQGLNTTGALSKSVSAPQSWQTPMTPQQLVWATLYQRGFLNSAPGPTPIDPKMLGNPTGPGFQTNAGIQIIDGEGRAVDTAFGSFRGGKALHAEEDACRLLQARVLKGAAKGGVVRVAVDQEPCSSCQQYLRDLAKHVGARQVEAYSPTRASLQKLGTPAAAPPTVGRPSGTVSPKTASRGAFQGGKRQSPQPYLVYREQVPLEPDAGPTPSPNIASPAAPRRAGAGTPASQPVNEAAPDSAIPVRSKVAAQFVSDELDLKISRYRLWIGGALQVIGALQELVGAIAAIASAESRLQGGAFVLQDELEKARQVNAEANRFATEYRAASSQLRNLTSTLFLALADPKAASIASYKIGDLGTKLRLTHDELLARLDDVHTALQQVEATREAANRLLNDPNAVKLLSIGSTAPYAHLIGAHEDLSRISAQLRPALDLFAEVVVEIRDDAVFVEAWDQRLFEIARRGGAAHEVTIGRAPTIRFYPGMADEQPIDFP